MVELEDLDGASAHAIAAPAEDYGVDPPRQDPLDKHLSLTTMEKPADDVTHEPDEASMREATKQRNPVKGPPHARAPRAAQVLQTVELRSEDEVVRGEPTGGVRP